MFIIIIIIILLKVGEANSGSNICDVCTDDNCETCSPDPVTCTKCKTGQTPDK